MEVSRRIARIVGPVLVVLALTEGFNIEVFAGNPAQVVFLNGTLLFAAGVAILQAYRRWTLSLSVLVTVVGWAFLSAGLFRMARPAAAQLAAGPVTWGTLAVLIVIGGLLSFKGYGPSRPD